MRAQEQKKKEKEEAARAAAVAEQANVGMNVVAVMQFVCCMCVWEGGMKSLVKNVV